MSSFLLSILVKLSLYFLVPSTGLSGVKTRAQFEGNQMLIFKTLLVYLW